MGPKSLSGFRDFLPKPLHRLGKIALFVDAANVFYSQKTLGWKVDYNRFLKHWNETVVSARGHIAKELIQKAHHYLPFEKLKEKIKHS